MPIFDAPEDELFSTQAIERSDGAHLYLDSHAYHELRLPTPDIEGAIQDEAYDDIDVTDYVNDAQNLGVYEKYILAAILNAPASYIVISGTAGSGKSSTISHVVNYYISHINIPAGSHAHPAIIIDLQSSQDDICDLADEAVDEKERQAVCNEALQFLTDQLPNCLLEIVPSRPGDGDQARAASLDAIDRAREIAASPSTKEERPARARFTKVLTGYRRSAKTTLESWDNLINHTGKKSTRDQLWFWMTAIDLTIQEQINKTVKEGTENDKRTNRAFVVIDNIDPLPGYVQCFIHKTLLALSAPLGLKVILTARLSTLKSVGPYAQGWNFYPHCGPQPMDALRARLFRFVRFPEVFPVFRRSLKRDRPSQIRRQIKAAELLLRLSRTPRHEGALFRVLSSAAGDSLRRVFQMARWIFDSLDRDDTANMVSLVTDLPDLCDELGRRSLISDFMLAIREHLADLCAREISSISILNTITGKRDSQALLRRLATNSSRSILALCQRAPKYYGNEIFHCDQGVWREIFSDERSKQLGHEILLLKELLEHMNRETGRAVHLSDVRRALRDPVRSALNKCSHIPTDTASEIAEQLIALIKDDTIYEYDGGRKIGEFSTWSTSKTVSGILGSRRMHQPVRGFVSQSRFVVDLLHHEGRTDSLKARILSMLSVAKEGCLELSDVLEKFDQMNITHSHAVGAINEMLAKNTRLLWIDKGFRFPSWSSLYKVAVAGTRLTLTRTGWNYLLGLLGEADYVVDLFISEAIASPDEYGDNVYGRLKACHAGLSEVLKQDLECSEHLKIATEDAYKNGHAIAMSVASRCAPGIARIIETHVSQVALYQRSQSVEDALSIIDQWVTLLTDNAEAWAIDEPNGSSIASARILSIKSVAPWRLTKGGAVHSISEYRVGLDSLKAARARIGNIDKDD